MDLMHQSRLALDIPEPDHPETRSFGVPDADIRLYPTLFAPDEADAMFADLLENTRWRQEKMRLYGKWIDLPRKTAWYGDPGKSYSYSGITTVPEPWTPTLLAIKSRIEEVSDLKFNSVLLNLYRDGRDSVSWHSDDEPELGPDPVIGSVSFGSVRTFQLRHKHLEEAKLSIPLPHGSYLLMKGPTQRSWVHQVPKTAKPLGQRINLTFRVIIAP